MPTGRFVDVLVALAEERQKQLEHCVEMAERKHKHKKKRTKARRVSTRLSSDQFRSQTSPATFGTFHYSDHHQASEDPNGPGSVAGTVSVQALLAGQHQQQHHDQEDHGSPRSAGPINLVTTSSPGAEAAAQLKIARAATLHGGALNTQSLDLAPPPGDLQPHVGMGQQQLQNDLSSDAARGSPAAQRSNVAVSVKAQHDQDKVSGAVDAAEPPGNAGSDTKQSSTIKSSLARYATSVYVSAVCISLPSRSRLT